MLEPIFFYSGVVVLLALAFLMPLMAYIPKTILCAVIITSVVFLIEVEEIKPMWKTNSKIFKVKQIIIA